LGVSHVDELGPHLLTHVGAAGPKMLR
jgi:hypothetical protein